jgi:hypothetical protein
LERIAPYRFDAVRERIARWLEAAGWSKAVAVLFAQPSRSWLIKKVVTQ